MRLLVFVTMCVVLPSVGNGAPELSQPPLGKAPSKAATKEPAKAPTKAAPVPAPTIRVYAYDRGGLVGLYCGSPGGQLASGTPCKFAASLQLVLGTKRVTVARKVITRQGLENAFKVTFYKLPARLAETPILVVETSKGLSIWSGKLDDQRDGIPIPSVTPTLGHDKSGIASAGTATTTTKGRERPLTVTIAFKSEGKDTATSSISWTEPVVLGLFDIDADGQTELIELSSDDGGPRVSVGEYHGDAAANDPDKDFHASVGG